MFMYHCKILFYYKSLKLGHNGQRSRSNSDIFGIPTLKKKFDVASNVGFLVAIIQV